MRTSSEQRQTRQISALAGTCANSWPKGFSCPLLNPYGSRLVANWRCKLASNGFPRPFDTPPTKKIRPISGSIVVSAEFEQQLGSSGSQAGTALKSCPPPGRS